jgi:hypothetical protein
MSLAGVIVVLAVVVAILALARSWPSPSAAPKHPRREPPPRTRIPGAPYRVAAENPERDGRAAPAPSEYRDPAVPLREREIALVMERAYADALALRDGNAMVLAAERVLATTNSAALHARALRILEHGEALRGWKMDAKDARGERQERRV